MNALNPKQAHQVWLEAQEKVKDRVIAPTLYRALELGVGIAVDGDEFILGYSSADLPMSSHLRSSQHSSIIEQSLSEVLKQKVRLRVIEGTTFADYERYRQQSEARESTAATVSAKREQERRIMLAWEEVGEKITRSYARLQYRQFAQSRGLFIKWALGVINEAVNTMGYTEKSEEIQKRSLARVFEKLATVVEVPPAMLAYEFFRLREEGKLH